MGYAGNRRNFASGKRRDEVTAAASIRERKIGKEFDIIDSNGDGVITSEDFKSPLQRTHGNRPNFEKFLISCMQSWEKMLELLDKDMDGQVSREEFVSYHLNASPEELREMTNLFSDAIFELFDRDQDQRISQQEFVSGQIAFGVPETESGEIFTRLDSDSDGYLSIEEFKNLVADFVLSDDPTSPGNHLIGKL
jgi:Ca2+-binding EF-hand superfamily protein